MKIFNKSRKIIGINGKALLPEETMEIYDEMRNHPVVSHYLNKKIIIECAEEKINDVKPVNENIGDSKGKEAEIKAVKAMKKDELFSKAINMGLEIKDDDTVDILKEKIITALGDM